MSSQRDRETMTPQGRDPSSHKWSSLSNSKAFGSSTSSLPFSRPPEPQPVTREPQPKMSSTRANNTQPTYNLFTGEMSASRPPSTLRQSILSHNRSVSHESAKENMPPPDAEEYETQRRRIEELKAEIGTLQFSISNLEQERDLRALQQEQELRDLHVMRDQDFKLKQEMQSERDTAVRKLEATQDEMKDLRSGVTGEKTGLEKKLRGSHEEVRLLQEQLDDLAASKDEAARVNERRSTQTQAQVLTLERRVQELEQESSANDAHLEQAQTRLRDRDARVAELEANVLRLKAQTGDADTIAIIRRELSDQVRHIRALEATNRDQLSELKHLRQVNKSVGVLEEEKRTLQRRLQAADGLEHQLDEAKLQRRRLEDERRAWTAYLETVSRDEDMKFDSPEAVAKALIAERLNSASLLDHQGILQADISERDTTIKALVDEKRSLQDQLSKAKTAAPVGPGGPGGPGDDKSRLRFDRQRTLLVKEVEYLRAQLKAFDAEDVTFHSETHDEQKSQRVQELEELVDQYKEEVQSLQQELSSLSLSAAGVGLPQHTGTSKKRLRTDGDDEDTEDDEHQLGQLKRKNRKLQDDLSTITTQHHVLSKDLSVAREQLNNLKEQSKTRVLSLRSNPTSDFEAIKLSTLESLKRENSELLAHMQNPTKSSNRTTFRTIPHSTLDAAQRAVTEARAETASARKSAQRLKEVWSAKSAEFREAIFSTLGWTVTFIPNGKMRVESVFYPSVTDEHENSILFDGERGTMKISGGPRSKFAHRIASQVKFWVREKNSIPGFLAALTLEFFEEQAGTSTR